MLITVSFIYCQSLTNILIDYSIYYSDILFNNIFEVSV